MQVMNAARVLPDPVGAAIVVGRGATELVFVISDPVIEEEIERGHVEVAGRDSALDDLDHGDQHADARLFRGAHQWRRLTRALVHGYGVGQAVASLIVNAAHRLGVVHHVPNAMEVVTPQRMRE